MPVHSRLATPSSFATGKTERAPILGDPLYQEDFYDQRLIKPSGGSGEIVYTGVDLENKGGMVMIKSIVQGTSECPMLIDTELGIQKYWELSKNIVSSTDSNSVEAFTTTGLRMGSNPAWNDSSGNRQYMYYTFAKQEKFFDIIKYTGNGEDNHTIAHNLNGTVGMMWIKGDIGESWAVYHRGYNAGVNPELYNTSLYDDGVATTSPTWTYWGTPGTQPTTTHFTVGNTDTVNKLGTIYYAYIFGHNELESEKIFGPERNKPMIFCGRLGANQNGVVQDIGMEAQLVLSKTTNASYNTGGGIGDTWRLIDAARNMSFSHDSPWFSLSYGYLNPQMSVWGQIGCQAARGWRPRSQGAFQDTVYMAIGGNAYKNPDVTKAGLDTIFVQQNSENPGTYNKIGYDRPLSTRKQIDLYIAKRYTNTQGNATQRGNNGEWRLVDRAMGATKNLWPSWASTIASFATDQGTNVVKNVSGSDRTFKTAGHGTISAMTPMSASDAKYWSVGFTKQRKFFDLQAYDGNGSTLDLYHNLESDPEMIWFKDIDTTQDWLVYHKDLGTGWKLALNQSTGKIATGATGRINSIDGTKINIEGSLLNLGGNKYLAYMFASFPGFSKIGSYNANAGNTIDIDCGFQWTQTDGPALIIIKRTDAGSSGKWMWWAREYSPVQSTGSSRFLITSGTYKNLDQYSAETEDLYKTDTGIRIAATTNNPINTTGGEYIYYVVAPDT